MASADQVTQGDDIIQVSPPKVPRLDQPVSRPQTSTTTTQSQSSMPQPAACAASSAESTASPQVSTDPQTSSAHTHQHATRSSTTVNPARASLRQSVEVLAAAAPNSTPAGIPTVVDSVSRRCLDLARANKWADMLCELARYSGTLSYQSFTHFASDLSATLTAWYAVGELVLATSSPPLFPLGNSTHPLVVPLITLLTLEGRFPRPPGWPLQRWNAVADVRVALEAMSNTANAVALGDDLVTTAASISLVWPYVHNTLRRRHLAALAKIHPELSTQRIADELRLPLHEAPMFAVQDKWSLTAASTLLLAQSIPPHTLNNTITPNLVYRRPDPAGQASTRATSTRAIVRLTEQLWQLESGV